MGYTRHELKQDKFAESAAEAVHGVVEHRSGIIKWTIVAVLACVVIGGGWWYCSWSQSQAADALGQAMLTYNAPVAQPGVPQDSSVLSFSSDQERLLAAKKAFYNISAHYGATTSGRYARYMAAACEQELGNPTVASQQLQALASNHDREIASLAKFALSGVDRAQKHDDQAAALLQTLIDKPTNTVPKVNAELALADLYVAQQRPDKARVLYDQIAKDNPQNELGELAKAHSDQLK